MKSPQVSLHHKSHHQLHHELEAAKQEVAIGGVYSHYKYPENRYTVLNFGFREASDELCVIYQAEYDDQLIFIRELKSWLETPMLDGQKVARFTLIEGHK